MRKHILNKHSERLDNVRMETQYFNNYLKDPRRPELPESPGGAKQDGKKQGKEKQHDKELAQHYGHHHQPDQRPMYGGRASVKERLGRHPGIRVTHAAHDPRSIVDYSDVDLAPNHDLF